MRAVAVTGTGREAAQYHYFASRITCVLKAPIPPAVTVRPLTGVGCTVPLLALYDTTRLGAVEKPYQSLLASWKLITEPSDVKRPTTV